MTWSVTLPGQPPSLNDLYQIVTRYARSGKVYKGIGKNPAAVLYHDGVVPQLRVAKPSRWAPEGLVRIVIDAHLARDIDCDNLGKVLMDAIEAATGINDARYLTCWRSKEHGSSNPRLVLEFSDARDDVCHCGAGS